jgi:hypothetical protein
VKSLSKCSPMFLYYWLPTALLALALQSDVSQIPEDGLNTVERAQLEKEGKIDNRIKVYEAASIRCHASIRQGVTTNDYNGISEMLKSWTRLLSASLKDIDAHIQRKKKSRTLIQYEIRLRKEITEMQDFKLRAPAELQEDFEQWSAGAETVHKQFVDILFSHE